MMERGQALSPSKDRRREPPTRLKLDAALGRSSSRIDSKSVPAAILPAWGQGLPGRVRGRHEAEYRSIVNKVDFVGIPYVFINEAK